MTFVNWKKAEFYLLILFMKLFHYKIYSRFKIRSVARVWITFFELLEHDVQGDVFEHEVAWILIELTESSQRCVVIGVDKGEILDVQHCDYICSGTLVNRYPRESWKSERDPLLRSIVNVLVTRFRIFFLFSFSIRHWSLTTISVNDKAKLLRAPDRLDRGYLISNVWTGFHWILVIEIARDSFLQ